MDYSLRRFVFALIFTFILVWFASFSRDPRIKSRKPAIVVFFK